MHPFLPASTPAFPALPFTQHLDTKRRTGTDNAPRINPQTVSPEPSEVGLAKAVGSTCLHAGGGLRGILLVERWPSDADESLLTHCNLCFSQGSSVSTSGFGKRDGVQEEQERNPSPYSSTKRSRGPNRKLVREEVEISWSRGLDMSCPVAAGLGRGAVGFHWDGM